MAGRPDHGQRDADRHSGRIVSHGRFHACKRQDRISHSQPETARVRRLHSGPGYRRSRQIFSDGYLFSINHAETLGLACAPDGSNLAGVDGSDFQSGRRFPLLRAEREQWNLYEPTFSPGDRWIVFLAKASAAKSQIFVARLKGLNAIPKEEWLPDRRFFIRKPRFSPDGGLIYFTLDRENSRSIHAVRFDLDSGKPLGEPLLVYDFPEPRKSMYPVNSGQLEISVARDKLGTMLSEANWNIWITTEEIARVSGGNFSRVFGAVTG